MLTQLPQTNKAFSRCRAASGVTKACKRSRRLNDPLSHSLLRHTIRQVKKLTMWRHVAVLWILHQNLDACAAQAGASKHTCELAKHDMNVHLSCATVQPIYKTILRCYVDKCLHNPNLHNRKIESLSHCCYFG